MKDPRQIKQNSDGSFSFPWGGIFWLHKVTGTANNCHVNQEIQSVSTYTGHESVSVPGRHDNNGNYVLGTSVSVPVSRTSTHTRWKSDFWVRKADGEDSHFEFSQKVPRC